MADEKKNPPKKSVVVPLKWVVPEGIITRFASHMVIQTIENEFKLSFFELKPKIQLSPLETPPTEVIAECVGSIIVSPHRMPKFIDTLKGHLDKFEKSKEAETT